MVMSDGWVIGVCGSYIQYNVHDISMMTIYIYFRPPRNFSEFFFFLDI